jgi:hypothetical protein
MKNRFNYTGIAFLLHGIGVIIGGVHFWPVKLSLACDTWFVVIDSLTAFLLGVIHDFAVDTKFTISGSVGFGLVGLVVVLPVAVVVGGPVVLTPRAIVGSVGVRLESSILPLLRPESRDVLLVGLPIVGLLVDGVNCGRLFVHFQLVIGEVNFVSIFYHQSGLILVR